MILMPNYRTEKYKMFKWSQFNSSFSSINGTGKIQPSSIIIFKQARNEILVKPKIQIKFSNYALNVFTTTKPQYARIKYESMTCVKDITSMTAVAL